MGMVPSGLIPSGMEESNSLVEVSNLSFSNQELSQFAGYLRSINNVDGSLRLGGQLLGQDAG